MAVITPPPQSTALSSSVSVLSCFHFLRFFFYFQINQRRSTFSTLNLYFFFRLFEGGLCLIAFATFHLRDVFPGFELIARDVVQMQEGRRAPLGDWGGSTSRLVTAKVSEDCKQTKGKLSES